jgi:divalent metal cation (Fe/Co/Zn/Cd) transporter
VAEHSRDAYLRTALRISATSAAWTVVASASAIIIGFAGGSLALVALGVVGVLDCAASATLVTHFRDARGGGTAEWLERLALHVVTAALVAVGLATGVASVLHLLNGDEVTGSLSGVILAAVSLVALTLLSWRKRHVSVRLPSHALLADSHLSAVGAILAAVTLAGTTASSSLEWWWADPSAALVIAIGAIGLGFAMRREPEDIVA